MDIKNILIVGNVQEEFEKQKLSQYTQNFRFVSVEEITEADFIWADVYVGSRPSTNFDLSKLKWVHSFNAGVNNFLAMEGWKEQNILLTRTICSFGKRISEYCLSYVLRDLQYHSEFQQKQHDKNWQPKTPKMLKDRTILIYGTGEIGQDLARSFHFFGATVYGVSRMGQQKDYFKEVVEINSEPALLLKADYIISTLPLTNETSQLFNKHYFKQMRNSFFINVGRGATVDEEALVQALNNGNLRFAVLDVVTEEPLPKHSMLWERQDVMITPHISAVTELNEATSCFFDTLKKVENNEKLSNKVDFVKGY
ncbi:D-2-hydroxyacid dehydrogenase [Bacillus sp. AK128]